MSEAQSRAALLRKQNGTQARGWKRPLRIHCKNNHELIEENIYLRKDGERACRICRNACAKSWVAKLSPEQRKVRRIKIVALSIQWAKNNPEKFKRNQAKQELRPEVKLRRKKFYEETKTELWRKYSVLKSKAKTYQQEFTLTQEDYELLVRDNACLYCSGTLPEVGYGVDRRDNRLGYTLENSAACCERCNEKKGSLEGLGFTYPRTVELLMELLGQNEKTNFVYRPTRLDHGQQTTHIQG